MQTIKDFEDMIAAMNKHKVRYLVIGGMAFIFHAKPRYTKDMDLWVEFTEDNLQRANEALGEFGSPQLLSYRKPTEITQIGVPPARVDFILDVEGERFAEAWEKRIQDNYGSVLTNWLDIDTLLRIKSGIAVPKHQEDARVLRDVMALQAKKQKR